MHFAKVPEFAARFLDEVKVTALCAAETRCAGCGGCTGATQLDQRDHGEDRQVIDLLRNALAAVLRFFAPRAIVAAENHLLRHQLVVPPLLVAASPAPQTRPMADDDVGDPSALAPRGGDRGTTRDGSPVASSGLAAVVALPLEPSGRPGADRRRVAGPHPADVAGEPPVGREPDCWRARETRLAGLAAHGGEVPVLVRNHPRRAGCQGANVLVGVSPQWGEI